MFVFSIMYNSVVKGYFSSQGIKGIRGGEM